MWIVERKKVEGDERKFAKPLPQDPTKEKRMQEKNATSTPQPPLP